MPDIPAAVWMSVIATIGGATWEMMRRLYHWYDAQMDEVAQKAEHKTVLKQRVGSLEAWKQRMRKEVAEIENDSLRRDQSLQQEIEDVKNDYVLVSTHEASVDRLDEKIDRIASAVEELRESVDAVPHRTADLISKLRS
jgi:septation ring formation regulator EzrA